MFDISNSIKKRMDSRTLRHKGYTYIWKLLRFVLLVGLSFMILYPMFVKFSASLKSTADMMDATVVFIPRNPTLQNYKIVLNSVNYPVTLLFTILFCTVQSLLQLASCSLVAYGIARFKFKGHNLLSGTALGFKNGLYIYLLRQHFKNMPMALEEAAYIDGCGPFKTFLRIMLPGSVPMLVTVFLFSFVWQWNDTVYSGIFFPDIPTLANKLYGMVFSTMGAGTTLMTAVLESPKFFLLITPIVVLYLFTQKLFVQSISRSGIVG